MACEKRNILLHICTFQLIITIWRQIFDYLGFMWGPIVVNFFHMIFVIFGFFGAWQYKAKYVCCFTVWSFIWCGWNVFLLCFYLDVGILNKESDLLSLGTGSFSWWEANGPGCKSLFLTNQSGVESEPWRPLKPDLISGCIIPYDVLEITQASLHLLLTILGIYFSCLMNGALKNGEPNSTSKKMKMAPMFPSGYIAHPSQEAGFGESMDETEVSRAGGSGSRPMTPRRVKRRSGDGRPGGSLPRRHHHRSSTRSSRRHRPHSLPPALLDQHTLLHPRHYNSVRGHTNAMYQPSSSNSLVEEERPPSARSSYSNFHGTRGHTFRQSSNFLAAGPPGYTSETGV